MFACDVDGDGDNDVITSMNAHGYGLSWFENTTVGTARVFREHVILPQSSTATPVQFSQLHAVTVADSVPPLAAPANDVAQSSPDE